MCSLKKTGRVNPAYARISIHRSFEDGKYTPTICRHRKVPLCQKACPVPEEWRRMYLGGEGINSRLLWEHFLSVGPKIDPLSPDNVLILGMGPLGGTRLGEGSKMKFTYKSPAYNMYGNTNSAGGLGSQLRWSGYDHIVSTGKAKRPVYLWINNDSVEFRDASHQWNTAVYEADAAIKQELGQEKAEIACIVQAGENLVRVASIIVSRNRAGARGSCGCAFGSKNNAMSIITGHETEG
jgi:aldehyde:ferredoxin oxidoreductase